MDKFVVCAIGSYDGVKDPEYLKEANKKGLYPYCLVMPAGERNLGTVLSHEHIAGRDWPQLKSITSQLTEAVAHMHSKGYVHGDLKPLNVMRMGGRCTLIDLDASVSFGEGQYAGAKFSPAYFPPEMLEVLVQ